MPNRLFAALATLWIFYAVPVLLLAAMTAQDEEQFRFPPIRGAVDAIFYVLLILPPLLCVFIWFRQAGSRRTVASVASLTMGWGLVLILALPVVGLMLLAAGGLFLS
ncbi:hypothetical protein CA233_10655 [Sphingomonas sp. ABOLD]|jgi:hypothetical protein|nr:hypothetical protein CA234_18530 [Sphingomonas sp. ABOLE]RSV47776.1 hypothetical protein CA233_10655 [Sphingomonas sp. ABOLD]